MRPSVLVLLLLAALAALCDLSRAASHDRHFYEKLLNEVEREMAERVAERWLLEARQRRSSEKKSYPRNCYFSPIQCLFTRS